MKKFDSMFIEELWSLVKTGDRNFNHTMALRILATRGEDVSGELQRIVRMLHSDDKRERILGWDAFRNVFREEMKLARGYTPYKSTEKCREKLKPLAAMIEAQSKAGLD